jgi:molybdopterin molybdotransferase
MVERRTPVKVEEAVHKVMEYMKHGEVEEVLLKEACGRYLGESIIATHPVPPFDRSPYDGFAIRAEDSKYATRENPVSFKVVETIGAGKVASAPLQPFHAVRIMTGAQMPEGADAVVMLELTHSYVKEQQTFMSIKRSFSAGDNISFKGEDVQRGEVLVEKGTKINPGTVALLATFGYSRLQVVQKPRIGVFATGTELLSVDQELEPGKIRNSNAPMVCAQIEQSGGIAIDLGILEDDFEKCYGAVEEAINSVDFLITTGGVSVGDFDYLPAIYEKIGANVLFNKVGMRPGSVTTVAELDGKLLFGLSGNPSACYVGFELFTYPIIKSFLHSKNPHHSVVKATLGSDFLKANPFTRFVRTSIEYTKEGFVVNPARLDKSNVVSSLAVTNGLTILPGGTKGFQKGQKVDVLLTKDMN